MRIRYTYIIHLVLILLYYFTRSDDGYQHFLMHGDNLYLPHLYKDMVVQGHPLRYWHSTPSLYAFPDIFFFFIIRFILHDFRWALLVYCALQYLCIIWLMDRSARLAFRNYTPYHAAAGSFLFAIYLLAGLLENNMYESHQVLSSAAHAGTFINALLCVYLLLRYLRRPHFRYPVFIFLLAVVAVFSDRLFLTVFLLPAFIALLVYIVLYRQWRNWWLPAMLPVAALTGLLLLGLAENTLVRVPGALRSNITPAQSLQIMLGHYRFFIYPFTVIGWTGILAAASLLLLPLRWVRARRERDRLTVFFVIFLLLAVCSILAIPPYTAMYRGADCLRYTIYAFHLLLFFLPFLAPGFITADGWKSFTSLTALLFIFVFIMIMAAGRVWTGARHFARYKPPEAVWADAHADSLHYGMANYWTAKQITLFSERGVVVVPVAPDGTPYVHEWSELDYMRPQYAFRFIIGIPPVTAVSDTLQMPGEPVYMLSADFTFCRLQPGVIGLCP